MRFQYHLSQKSTNGKTGDIPVSTTSANSCGDCPLKENGCYANNYPLKYHWDAVSRFERGFGLKEFAAAIRALPAGQVWRHNQAGDLPRKVVGKKSVIDAKQLSAIVDANTGRSGMTYTHHDPTIPENAAAIKTANEAGFTINLSADNLAEADQFKALGIAPVTVVLPISQRTNLATPAGNKVVICPKETRGIQCDQCKLCAWKDRQVIIGFPAHGTSKKKAELVALG